jgi:hypothetical protein
MVNLRAQPVGIPPIVCGDMNATEQARKAGASKVLGWPRRCKLAHASLWERSCKGLKLAQLLGQLGVFLTRDGVVVFVASYF